MVFIKKKEDFKCENCGQEVVGDGFTNHCPKCLYSKHVDIDPGDRASDCGGLMKPTGYEQKNGEERIIHECVICGYRKPNRVSPKDDQEELIKIAQSNRF